VREDRYLSRVVMTSDKQQEKSKTGKAELHEGNQLSPAGRNMGIRVFEMGRKSVLGLFCF